MQTLTTRPRVSLALLPGIGRRVAAGLLLAASLSTGLLAPVAQAADRPDAAARLIEQAVKAMRIDPDSSRRNAQQALDLLKQEPNADLEIRARLILLRLPVGARQGGSRARDLPGDGTHAARQAPGPARPALLTCEGDVNETRRRQRPREVALRAGGRHRRRALSDDEMLAGALFSRGYLMGVQGEYATGLADLRRAQALFEKRADAAATR